MPLREEVKYPSVLGIPRHSRPPPSLPCPAALPRPEPTHEVRPYLRLATRGQQKPGFVLCLRPHLWPAHHQGGRGCGFEVRLPLQCRVLPTSLWFSETHLLGGRPSDLSPLPRWTKCSAGRGNGSEAWRSSKRGTGGGPPLLCSVHAERPRRDRAGLRGVPWLRGTAHPCLPVSWAPRPWFTHQGTEGMTPPPPGYEGSGFRTQDSAWPPGAPAMEAPQVGGGEEGASLRGPPVLGAGAAG